MIAGGAVLGATSLVAAPVVLLAGGGVALVGGAIVGGKVIYEKINRNV